MSRTRRWGVAFAVILLFTGLAISQDAWTVSQPAAAGRDLNTVYFADSKRGWIGGDDGYVAYTNDSGKTWTQQPLATSEAINDIYFRNKENGYLLAATGIFKTEDSGKTWRESVRFRPSDFDGGAPELYSMRFSSKKKGWVIGSISRRDRVVDSLFLYTNDQGTSWLRASVPTRVELIHLDFVNDDHGWIVGGSGTILVTSNAGETWTVQRSGTDSTLYNIDFRNERVGWAVGEQGTVIRTTDGGSTWFPVRVPVRNTLLNVRFVDEDHGWIVGRGGVILRSEDGGETWSREESHTTQNLYALFADKKYGWAVGGEGIVLHFER